MMSWRSLGIRLVIRLRGRCGRRPSRTDPTRASTSGSPRRSSALPGAPPGTADRPPWPATARRTARRPDGPRERRNGHTLATTVPAGDRSATAQSLPRRAPNPPWPARPGPGDETTTPRAGREGPEDLHSVQARRYRNGTTPGDVPDLCGQESGRPSCPGRSTGPVDVRTATRRPRARFGQRAGRTGNATQIRLPAVSWQRVRPRPDRRRPSTDRPLHVDQRQPARPGRAGGLRVRG